MKKKILSTLLAAGLCLLLAACSGGDPLSAIDRATSDEVARIRSTLESCGIAAESCEKAQIEDSGDSLADSVTGALLDAFDPYTITDSEGNTYRLVLNKGDRSVVAVVDESTGEFVYGGLDGLFSGDE